MTYSLAPAALLALLGPAALLLADLAVPLRRGTMSPAVLDAGRWATLVALGAAVLAAAAVAIRGTLVSPVLGWGGYGLSVRLDALSATLFLLVAFVGVIVVEFARRYLAGDPGHAGFIGRLTATLASVMLLVLAGNVGQLFLGWIAASLMLHRLLLFRPERARAIVAARKKFVAARLGDAALAGALVLLVGAFGSPDIGGILAGARAMAAGDGLTTPVTAATLLLALAAILKSAQFPLHGWLPDVIETPTPVSALLHAGLINAGGFLVLRFADVMAPSASAGMLLLVIGGVTALFGSIVMLTQTSIKVSLAYSTIGQMGFMLFQCGLGAYPIALLHIVAHSLYKAHAFLSSGSVVDLARASWVPAAGTRRAATLAIALAGALTLYLGLGAALGKSLAARPAVVALGAILVMGVTHLLAQSFEGRARLSVFIRTGFAATATTLLFFGLEWLAELLLAGAMPVMRPLDAAALVGLGLVVTAFAAVTVLQWFAPALQRSRGWRAAQVHLRHGLYITTLFDRLVGAYRLPTSTTPEAAR